MSKDITITIPLRLPGLNEYTRANRANRYEGAKTKAEYERVIAYYLRGLPVLRPVGDGGAGSSRWLVAATFGVPPL